MYSFASLKRTTAPTIEPVTLAEAKLHLRIDGTEEDSLITDLLKSAREWCETYQGRGFLTQTWRMKLDHFPSCADNGHRYGQQEEIRLPYAAPLASVTSIVYVASDGTSTTINSSVYTVDSDSEPGRVYLAYGQTWPTPREQPQAITITYVVGQTAASSVSGRVKSAIKLLVGHLYEHREHTTEMNLKDVPLGVKSLLSCDRVSFLG